MANKKKIAVEREFPEELMDKFTNRGSITQFSDVDEYLQTLNEIVAFMKQYPSTGYAAQEGSEFYSKELGNKKYLIETKYKELFNEVLKAINKLKNLQTGLKEANIAIDKVNDLMASIKNTRAPRKQAEPTPEVKPTVDETPAVNPEERQTRDAETPSQEVPTSGNNQVVKENPEAPTVDRTSPSPFFAEAARLEEVAAQTDFDDALVAEDRYFRALQDLAELEARVERLKAEHERTLAKFDSHYSDIHEAEARVHDAKAAAEDLKSGKKQQTTTVSNTGGTPEIKPNFTEEHLNDIEEQQKKAARADLARVLNNATQKLNEEERARRVGNQQRVAAADDVARATGAAAQTATRDAHTVRVRARQRVSAARDNAAVARRREAEARERERLQRIAYQQGLAAAADLQKVADKFASDPETLDEVSNAIRSNNVRNVQGLAAASDTAKVTAHNAAVAAEDYRKAKIEEVQTNAAANDTVKVTAHNADVSAKAAHDEHVRSTQSAAAVRDVKRVIDGRYGLVGKDIIQNLPPKSPLNEVFETPGMTDAEIEESRRKLAEVPEKKATPTKTWVEMSKSINQLLLKKETGDINLTPDDIYALYFLRRHPEAAPSQKVLNDLLVWAGITPLEATTPRKDAPAATQTPRNDAAPVKKEDPIVPATDKEVKDMKDGIAAASGKTEVITPATDEEIKAMKAGVAEIEKKAATDEEISDEELDDLRKLLGTDETETKDAPVQDEKKETPAEPKKEEPKKEEPKKAEPEKPAEEEKKAEKKGRKVKKRTSVKEFFNSKKLMPKALLFSERKSGRSKSYIALSVAIANLKSAYKANTPEDNTEILLRLNDSIKNDTALTPEETRLLYKKYCKLFKKIEKYNKKNNGKNLPKEKPAKKSAIDEDELQAAIDETMNDIFGEEVGRGR